MLKTNEEMNLMIIFFYQIGAFDFTQGTRSSTPFWNLVRDFSMYMLLLILTLIII